MPVDINTMQGCRRCPPSKTLLRSQDVHERIECDPGEQESVCKEQELPLLGPINEDWVPFQQHGLGICIFRKIKNVNGSGQGELVIRKQTMK